MHRYGGSLKWMCWAASRPSPFRPATKSNSCSFRAKLRKKIAKQNRELDALDLLRYTDDIRTVYLHIRDALLRPPVFCNTDGDPILFHTLKFRIGSAQAAFDALAPLAYGDSREDLLDYAEVSPDGTLLSAEIEWRKQGNQKFKSWDNTILGRCSIDGRTLVAEVNSKRRAETLRHEIEQRLGLLAVHQSTVTQTAQELAKTQDLQKATASSHAETSAMAFDPEARELAKAEMQKMAEGWVHQKIPALGRRTPLEAVQNPDGREIVEALLLEWERRDQSAPSPAIIGIDTNNIRRLLGLTSPQPHSAR